MRRSSDSFILLLGGLSLALATGAQAGVTVEALNGSATVAHLGAQAALASGDALNERDVVTVAPNSALQLRFGSGDIVELSGDTAIAIERLPDTARSPESKTILSLDHGLLHVVRPGGDDLVLPFYLFLGDQRAAISDGEFYFERAPRFVEACAQSGQLSLPPTEFLSLRIVSGQNCYHNAGGDGPPRILQRDEAYFAQARERIGLLTVTPSTVAAANPVSIPVSSPAASASTAGAVAAGGAGTMVASASPTPISEAVLASPAEAMTPQPPVVPTEPPSATVDWVVNLASFSQSEQASDEVQRLQAAGYPAGVESREVGGIMRYRVQLRGFPTTDAARTAANEVASRFGYKDYFLIRNP